MRVRVLLLGLALVIGGSTMGCKSAPKLPWFSTADKTAAGAAVSTTASSAPQLPSEIAKQSEGLSAAEPVKITMPAATTAKSAGGAAPAYTASAVPSTYPSTGAQDYLSNSAAALKSAATSTAANTAAAPKSALPYNPAAVPPSPTSGASSTAGLTAPAADRYGMPAQDRYAEAYPATPPYTSGSVAGAVSDTAATASTTASTSSVPFASNPSSVSLGDRYATQSAAIASPVTAPSTNHTTTVQPASAVASLQPYRPGGTSSYPGTSANYEVATRPDSTSTSTTTNGTLYR